MSAVELAEAFRRLSTGDQTPPHPWAALSHVGITWVGDTAFLEVAGYTDQAGFDLNVGGEQYRVMVRRVA